MISLSIFLEKQFDNQKIKKYNLDPSFINLINSEKSYLMMKNVTAVKNSKDQVWDCIKIS